MFLLNVSGTMMSSHQAGGLPCRPPFWTAAYSAVPAGMPEQDVGQRGKQLSG